MKMLRVFMTLAIFALALCKESLSAQVTRLYIGSEEAVIENGLRNADQIQVFIQQLQADGRYLGVSQGGADRLTFSNKADLDRQVAFYLSKVAQGVIDNNAGQNKNGSFSLSVVAVKRYPETGRLVGFLGGYLGEFKLIRNGTSYSLPDLSSFVVGVPNMNVLYYIQDLAWARITITDENGTRTIDSAEGSDPMIDLSKRCLVFPKELALSGMNGPYQIKISMISGLDKKFQKFDGDGNLVPEDPPTIGMTLVSALASGVSPPVTDAVITVRGGDMGRSFKLQSSTNFTVWTDVSDSHFSVRYTYPYLDHQTFTVSGATENSFFRLLSEKKTPTYPSQKRK